MKRKTVGKQWENSGKDFLTYINYNKITEKNKILYKFTTYILPYFDKKHNAF